MTEIGATGGALPGGQDKQKGTQVEGGGLKDLGSETFLKLMVTQMRYQDPFSGGEDMGDFMSQVAQFTTMERLIELQQTVETFAGQQSHNQALGMLNRTVDLVTENGEEVRGEVTAVSMKQGEPLLTVDGKEYPLAAVTRVEGAAGQEADTGTETDNEQE